MIYGQWNRFVGDPNQIPGIGRGNPRDPFFNFSGVNGPTIRPRFANLGGDSSGDPTGLEDSTGNVQTATDEYGNMVIFNAKGDAVQTTLPDGTTVPGTVSKNPDGTFTADSTLDSGSGSLSSGSGTSGTSGSNIFSSIGNLFKPATTSATATAAAAAAAAAKQKSTTTMIAIVVIVIIIVIAAMGGGKKGK